MGENLLLLFAFLISLDLVFNKKNLSGKERFRSRQEIDSSYLSILDLGQLLVIRYHSLDYYGNYILRGFSLKGRLLAP